MARRQYVRSDFWFEVTEVAPGVWETINGDHIPAEVGNFIKSSFPGVDFSDRAALFTLDVEGFVLRQAGTPTEEGYVDAEYRTLSARVERQLDNAEYDEAHPVPLDTKMTGLIEGLFDEQIMQLLIGDD